MAKAIANIGDGATIYVGSDCSAATVVKATARTVVLQRDIATPTENSDYFGSQDYTFEPNPRAEQITFSLRKNGGLYMKGTEMGRNGINCTIGSRRQYRNPSF